VEQRQGPLQKWDARARRLHPRMEITGEGLTLGAGTMLAGMGRDECGRPRLALDDEPRALALLATAYDRPVEACVVAKLRRACERWTEGEKALAHIHLAHAGVPPCGPDQALRLFVADELIEAGVAPRILMTAQGFDPATLDLLKANFNQAQPRWPAGSGRDSGRWSGGASVDSAGVKEFIARLLLEAARRAARALRPSETKPPKPEVVKPEAEPVRPPAAEQGISAPKPSDFVGEDFGKLGVGVDKPELSIRELDPHAIERMAERGVSSGELESTVAEPLIILQQTEDKFLFLSDSACVVVTRDGRVITTYPAANFDARIKEILKYVHQGSRR
jgi:hypothetical protein